MSPAHRTILRRVLLALSIAALLYIGSYFLLTRWSRAVLSEFDQGGFWYVPVEPQTMTDHPPLRAAHRAAVVLYHPIWRIDRRFLGGPYPESVIAIDTTTD